MTQRHTTARAALIASALLLTAWSASAQNMPAAPAPDQEKCYGVALQSEGRCDAAAGAVCSGGMATADHQGTAWKPVPKGSCQQLASPTSPTGFGQLQPFEAGAKPAPAPAPAPTNR